MEIPSPDDALDIPLITTCRPRNPAPKKYLPIAEFGGFFSYLNLLHTKFNEKFIAAKSMSEVRKTTSRFFIGLKPDLRQIYTALTIVGSAA